MILFHLPIQILTLLIHIFKLLVYTWDCNKPRTSAQVGAFLILYDLRFTRVRVLLRQKRDRLNTFKASIQVIVALQTIVVIFFLVVYQMVVFYASFWQIILQSGRPVKSKK